MGIQNIQGMNAYTANALITDTASVQNSPKEKTDVETNMERTPATQEAFQVNITQQALALQAENTEDMAKEGQRHQLAQRTDSTQPLQSPQGTQLDIFG